MSTIDRTVVALPAPESGETEVGLPGRLVRSARAWADRPALRQKDLGIYRERSWAEYLAVVAQVADGFRRRGVGPGDVVTILADNREEWVLADLAAQGIGATACGIYPTNSAAEVAYIIRDSGSRFLVVGDQEQTDKIVEVADEVPDLQHVVIIDPRGTRGYDLDLEPWKALAPEGEVDRAVLDAFLADVGRLDPDAPAVLIYTSGTTGPPKGVLLSHRNLDALADRLSSAMGAEPGDLMLSYLPLCHLAEKIFTELIALTRGCCVHFGESITTVQRDVTEVGPTIFLGVPRIWEKMQARVDQNLRRSSRLKRWAHHRALAAGLRMVEREAERPLTRVDRIRRTVLDLAVHGALRRRLGLERVRVAISAGAPVPPEVLRWFHAIGVRIREAYGLTEGGVTHLVPADARLPIGSVGAALDGVECRIAEDGEILLRSDTTFLGYLNQPQATEDLVDEDGWLASGDLGEIRDGLLHIVGRKKQIIITSGGKNLSPDVIENALKTSPYIEQAVAVGDRRNYVGALIQIDWEAASDWAADRRLATTSFEDLSSRPEVERLIEEEIVRANAHLARVESVRGFALLTKRLHQDDGELTATQKVKRSVVLDRYADLIDQIYAKEQR